MKNKLHNQLRTAGIAGIAVLALAVPTFVLAVIRTLGTLEPALIGLYAAFTIAGIITAIIFLRGFILLGKKVKNDILYAASYAMLISTAAFLAYDMASTLFIQLGNMLIYTLFVFLMGVISIFFGFGILKLEPKFGSIASIAGFLEILSGITLASILLSFVALLLVIPVSILEIAILFRAAKFF